jgi:hypothetical protein
MNPRLPPHAASLLVAVATAVCLFASNGRAMAQACERADFEGVVGTASATLRDMTAENTPIFQEKLRQLKDKRAWSYEQFVKEAAPLVADEQIAAFDAKSVDYLSRINAMGGEATGDAKPDCRLLDTLRANMAALVETQKQKWAYMFGKLDAEMAK